jgi:hypothetical protein
MEVLLRAWETIEPLWSGTSLWLGSGGLFLLAAIALVMVAGAGAYKQAFFWKHPDRSLDDAAWELLLVSVPFYGCIGVALVLIWFGPVRLGIDDPDRTLAFYQLIASVPVWLVAQIYWWGWVVERIRRPPT